MFCAVVQHESMEHILLHEYLAAFVCAKMRDVVWNFVAKQQHQSTSPLYPVQWKAKRNIRVL